MEVISYQDGRLKAYFHGDDIVQTRFDNLVFLQGLEDAQSGKPFNHRYDRKDLITQIVYEFGRQYYFEFIHKHDNQEREARSTVYR